MKTTYTYDHYYKYDEIKSILESFAQKYPELVTVETNCVSKGGLSQFAVTLTNKKTGEPFSKPGWYLDGNIHAGEVTSSMAAMHTIDYLLTNYGTDKEATQILDEMTIYVIPRVSPDGAEVYLTTPLDLRSAPIEYKSEKGGIEKQDLDGDGVVRMMKVPTPYGAWKADDSAAIGISLRQPSDTEGQFFDIYPEGVFEEYDGDENLKTKKSSWGLDYNRNFPLGWNPEYRQSGAGDYPLCNIETKGLADFVLSHPNIGGAAIGHTSGGLLLFPPGTRPSNTISMGDLNAFKEIAEMGREELGYLPMSIFDSFETDQANYDSGAFDDWCYQTQGIPCYTMEFWDINSKAGTPEEWGAGKGQDKKKTAERFAATLKWIKENCPEYYMDWQPYDHPTFGKVEIGGFNSKFTFSNPPEKFLLAECEHDTKFNIRFIKAMPKLVVDELIKTDLGNGFYQIETIVANKGYLPTNLSDEAIKLKVDKPVMVEIKGASEVISGKEIECAGNLDGFSRTVSGSFWGGNIMTFKTAKCKKKISWVIKGNAGDTITITTSSAKAGTASAEITL